MTCDGKEPLRLETLADLFRRRAEDCERLGALPAAKAWRSAAEDVEEAIERYDEELLTINQAIEESGYSYHGLRRLIREGDLIDYGEEGETLLRRGDLPRKPGTGGGLKDSGSQWP